MSSPGARFHVLPGGELRGEIRLPGDKSVSHRSVLFGSIADGDTEIEGLLEGEDVLATISAFRSMGVRFEGPSNGRLTVHGVGVEGLRAPEKPLDLGNSGTAMRLIAGLLAARPFDSTLVGDASLSARPMRRVADPLTQMGAIVGTSPDGTPPIRIGGTQSPLRSIEYRSPVASAQVKSSILIAGLGAEGRTCVTEPAPTRDHTERMLRAFGVEVEQEAMTACVQGGQRLEATRIEVPADISSAAFFLVGASIAPGSDLVLPSVGINPTRTGILKILDAMGAEIAVRNERFAGAEPVADLHVRSAQLHGIDVDPSLVALAIDEFPAIFVAAACAAGTTRISGAEELRHKESDRIESMAVGLRALGVDARATGDGMVIRGGPIGAGVVESFGDHRVAMSFAMTGLAASGPVEVLDCANVDTSFPGFVPLCAGAGLRISTE